MKVCPGRPLGAAVGALDRQPEVREVVIHAVRVIELIAALWILARAVAERVRVPVPILLQKHLRSRVMVTWAW